MNFPMIYADGQGETHFGVRDIPPPNPTGRMTDFGAVTTMFVFSVPAGTCPLITGPNVTYTSVCRVGVRVR